MQLDHKISEFSECPIIIVDLEATCDKEIPALRREIIEIGAVKILNGKKIGQFKKFIKPTESSQLSEYCMNLTHIKQEDINNGLDIETALRWFYKWATDNFQTDVIYLSWGQWDREILFKTISKTNLPHYYRIQTYRHYDLQSIYQKLVSSKKLIGLSNALKAENIKSLGHEHDAMFDAKNTYLVYRKRKEEINQILISKINKKLERRKRQIEKEKKHKEDLSDENN